MEFHWSNSLQLEITVAHIDSNNTMNWRQQAGWQFPTSKLARKETVFDTAVRQVLDHRPKDFRCWSEAFPGVYFLGKGYWAQASNRSSWGRLSLDCWHEIIGWHFYCQMSQWYRMILLWLVKRCHPGHGQGIIALSKWMLLPSNAHGCGGRLQAVQPLPKQNWSMNDSTAYKSLCQYSEKITQKAGRPHSFDLDIMTSHWRPQARIEKTQ